MDGFSAVTFSRNASSVKTRSAIPRMAALVCTPRSSVMRRSTRFATTSFTMIVSFRSFSDLSAAANCDAPADIGAVVLRMLYRFRRDTCDTEVAFARNEAKACMKRFDNDAYRAGFRPGGQRPYCNARRDAGKAMWLLRRLGKGFVEDPTQNLRPAEHGIRPPDGPFGAAIPTAKERIGVCHRVRHSSEVHRRRDVQLRRRSCRRSFYHLIDNWLRLRFVRQCVSEGDLQFQQIG